MEGKVTIYRPRKDVTGGGLVVLVIVFCGLTLPLIVAGLPVPTQKVLALCGFWLMGIALTLLPLGGKLEVGDDYIKTYFFGFTTTPKIRSSDTQAIAYGNLFYGGLGFGKGISFRATSNGKNKSYSIAEIVYGKGAITHARQVLESQLPKK